MELVAHLNTPQQEAVTYPGGPLVVFAGAGSGKTRVITHRVAYLVRESGVKPWRILAVTFTNKAAGEMRERLAHILGAQGGDVWVGTFHAICAKLLRKYFEELGVRRDFVIYDDGDQKAMVTRVLRDMKYDDKQYPPKQIAQAINRAKQEVIPPDMMPSNSPYDRIVKNVYETYEEAMQRSGALDFGDLIYKMVRGLENNDALRGLLSGRFEHILVDEFQDTNQAQYRLVRALGSTHRNICVVGDDDQSIYRWRGADRRNILGFRREFEDAHLVKLEQNYRSTKRILRVANAVISRSFEREPKELWTENGDGGHILVRRCSDERDEARLVVQGVTQWRASGRALKDCAIFYRIHAQSRVLEEMMRSYNLPYRVIGGMRFYERAEIKDALAYLRVLSNRDDDVSLLRIINVPARGIGKSTLDRLLDLAAARGQGVWGGIEAFLDDEASPTGAKKKLSAFADMIRRFAAKKNKKPLPSEVPLGQLDLGAFVAPREQRDARDKGPKLSELAKEILVEAGYLKALEADDSPESDARQENLEEFFGSIAEFEQEAESPTLEAFLELITLQTSEEKSAEGDDKLTLMTVHAAKGLEFPCVWVCGMEEDLFPYRSEDPEELDEERRLAYVAFTRAREHLVLSWASLRRIFGQPKINRPSRFLDELPGTDIRRVGEVSAPSQSQNRWREDPYEDRDEPHQQDEPVATPSRSVWSRAVRNSSPAPSSQRMTVDRDLEDGGEVRRGTYVRHAKFGVGKVAGVEGTTVTVMFPGWGTKQIVSRFLEPA